VSWTPLAKIPVINVNSGATNRNCVKVDEHKPYLGSEHVTSRHNRRVEKGTSKELHNFHSSPDIVMVFE
jgi:hypothetical protein